MGPIYRFLGMTVGVIKSARCSRRSAKRMHATLRTARTTKWAFDYLRDNLAFRLEKIEAAARVELMRSWTKSTRFDRRSAHTVDHFQSAEESTELYIKINSSLRDYDAKRKKIRQVRLLGPMKSRARFTCPMGPRACRAVAQDKRAC